MQSRKTSTKQKIKLSVAFLVVVLLTALIGVPFMMLTMTELSVDAQMMIIVAVVLLLFLLFIIGIVAIYKTTGQPYSVYAKFVLNSNPDDVPIITWKGNKLFIENMPKVKLFKSKKEVVIVIVAILIALFIYRSEIAGIYDDIQDSIAASQRQQDVDNAIDRLNQINENLESLGND